MGLRAYMPAPPEPHGVELLRGHLSRKFELHSGPDPPERADYQVLIAGRPSPEQLAASEELRALVIPWAGLPDEARGPLREHPELAIFNLHHNAGAVAELALTLLLAVSKRLLPLDRALRLGIGVPGTRAPGAASWPARPPSSWAMGPLAGVSARCAGPWG